MLIILRRRKQEGCNEFGVSKQNVLVPSLVAVMKFRDKSKGGRAGLILGGFKGTVRHRGEVRAADVQHSGSRG